MLTLQNNLLFQIPDFYKEFLRQANGINVFSNHLCLYGLRDSFARRGDDIYKPYNWPSHLGKIPIDAPESWIPIGGYFEDDSSVFFDLNESEPKIYRTDAQEPKILNEWENLEAFLVSEIVRLSQLFDEDGKQIDEDAPTTP